MKLEFASVMSIRTVVIIIPTYNEACVIEETIKDVFNAVVDSSINIHVLVFDSCSIDNTQAVITRLQEQYPKLHLQQESKKTGLGSAYLQAMQYATTELNADAVIEFDADLSHQPRYLLPMIEQLNFCDVVVGSRYVKGGSIPKNWGWHRKLLSILGNYVARVALTFKYKDFTSGFRATRAGVLINILPSHFLSNNYAYKLELLWRLHQSKAKIVEHPIEFVDRQKGESKLPANSIIDALRVLAILRFRELKSYLNMCAVGLIGLFIQCLIYNLLRLKCTPFCSAQLAVTAAIVNNFILNNHLTFKKRSLNNQLKPLLFFTGYSVLMILLQSNWVQLATHYLGTGYLKENLIVASGIVVGSFLNYFFYSRIVWRKKNTITLS